ncbi:hypothetical protein GQ457_11G011080 [Hibiscus cannabinus]
MISNNIQDGTDPIYISDMMTSPGVLLPTHLKHRTWRPLMQSHYIIISHFQVSKQSYQLLTSRNVSLMPDTSLHWMKGNSGCLLLHQESNADPMEKVPKSADFKANEFEIGTFNIKSMATGILD